MNTERLRKWPDRPDPELTTNITSLMNEAADRIEALEAALRKIAAYTDTLANARMAATGSYSAFDEPGSVQIARAALGE